MKKNLLLSALSGLILSLSFPLAISSNDLFRNLPTGIFAFFGFVPFLSALDSQDKGYTALKGFVFGIVFYLFTLFWITNAMLEFGGMSFFWSGAVVLTMVFYLSLFPALFAVLLPHLRKNLPLQLAAPALFVSLEILRNYFFTGFPWSNLAYSLVKFEKLIQIADITGIYGLVFAVIFINAAVYELVNFYIKKNKFPYASLIGSICIVLAFSIYGFIRIRGIDKAPILSKEKVALIQGNISQGEKWDANHSRKIIEQYLSLSREASKSGASLIVWPEASLPYSILSDQQTINIFSNDNFNSKFLIGATSFERKGSKILSRNSAFLIAPNGAILDRYHKTHLVPFSERPLFDKWLPFITKLIPPIAGDFEPGNEFKTFEIMGKKFACLICFESIFPELSRKFVSAGAEFLVNITNDAWFGNTSGPYQHFDMVKFRAIENRVFIVRAANTGISAVIDPVGRVINRTELFKDDFINADVEIKNISSIYTKIGDLFAYLCVGLTVLSLSTALLRRKRL